MKPPPTMTVSQWADKYRKLSPESAAEPGQWRTDRAPYQRGIMDAVNDPLVTDIVVIKSAQVGWTEMLGNVIGYYIEYDPAPILIIQPTIEMGQSWSKDRLAPMLRDTPCLRGKVKDPRSRDSNNTILHKTFDGGHLSIAGANSSAGLASRPIRILLCDEVDRYPPSAGTEGDPVNLARKRTTTFWNKKRLMGSTPTVKGLSRIEAAYAVSDQRRYFVPCPHCNELQTLKWANVKWPEGHPDQAFYSCEHCAAVITDADKHAMMQRGEWIAEKEFSGTAGFHINELYSPWVLFSEVVQNFLEARLTPETLKTWVNTSLGETWEEQGEAIDETGLLSRRENYGPEVPEKAVILTAGVDVQDNRLEIEVVAHADHGETWSLEYNVIHGDPSQPTTWQQLDDYLQTTFTHETGRPMRIIATCIDTGGHHTHTVYRYCKTRYARRIFATKGMGGQRPFVSKPSKANAGNVPLFTIGVDMGKDALYARLKVASPGAGYCHFPEHYDADYFAQLTAEKAVTKYVQGKATRAWVKKSSGGRNEALDCRLLAMAALEIINPNMRKLGQRLGTLYPNPQQAEAEDQARAERDVPKPNSVRNFYRPKRGGFVTGWKK
jgi:phage terminase large subunit GpA-like protein